MSDKNPSQDTQDPRLNRVLAEYLEAVERKDDTDPQNWIKRYPEFAFQLREFFATRSRLDQVIANAAFGENATLNFDTVTSQPNTQVRYFGDYELLEEIARGGMGIVYRARQVSLNRPVAVKMILAGQFATEEDVARFRAEAEAAANLDHPAIVPVYEIGQHEGHEYFSMKYIAGDSLAQWLKGRASPSSNYSRRIDKAELITRVRIVIDVARAVHFAHQRGIIHRDLKPANILIDADGQPHVTDFGLAKRVASDHQMTRTGAIVGTPSYMAPEQAAGRRKAATTAADIYGLGAILYTILTGRPPFESHSPIDTLMQVVQQPPTLPSELCAGLDADLQTICLKCLEKNPEDRYRSAGELADDLERWENREPIRAVPLSVTSLMVRWLLKNFRSLACVLLIGLISGLLVCEPVINMTAANLEAYGKIYRGRFPQQNPPWVLTAINSYPRLLGLLLLPLMLCAYFGMGLFTDWLVRPADRTSAVMAGLGVGTVASLTAFLFVIAWEAVNTIAVQPTRDDLQLIAAKADGDLSARKISDVYPSPADGMPITARQVMDKAFADLQSTIPIGIWIGFLMATCFLLLPATAQTIAAQQLRVRGDGRAKQVLHLVELSVPISLALVTWSAMVSSAPVVAIGIVLAPLLVVALVHPRHWRSVKTRYLLLAILVIAGVTLVITCHRELFGRSGVGSFVLMAMGATAAILAVTQRWRWWLRVTVYSTWMSAFFLAGGFIRTTSTSQMAVLEARGYFYSLWGSVVLALLIVAAVTFQRQPSMSRA